MTIVAFTSQQDGVATTTSAVTIAYRLAQEGHQTLLLDLHPLGHCALSLGLDSESGVYEWLVDDQPWQSQTVTIDSNGLRLLRGDGLTQVVDLHYYDYGNGRQRLVNKIRDIDIDGWVIIDTSRACMLGEAAIAAADVVVIPFRGDVLSLYGVYTTLQLIESLNPEVEVILLPTLMDLREKESRYALEEMQKSYGDKVSLPIPKRAAVNAASGYGQTIWDFQADGITDARNAYSALMERLMPKHVSVEQTDEILRYQQVVAELQNQLHEANAWRARQDLQGRPDALELRLESLEGKIDEVSQIARTLTEKWEKLRHLFDDNPKSPA